jgi:hypothetical protein
LVVTGALAACGGDGGGAPADEPSPEAAAVTAEEPMAQADATMTGEFVDLLASRGGRYSKAGWNHYGPGYFDLDAETGVLTGHGGMGLLWYSVQEFSDFELELEFRCSGETTNSGVFLRVPDVPTSDDYIYHSFEVQIYDAGEGIHMTGAVYDAEAPSHLASNPPGEWNLFRISFEGNHISVDLNGERVLDWEAEPRGKVEDFAPRGYIGLQNHDEESPAAFRNVRVRTLG